MLKIVVHDVTLAPGLTGLCAGYERGKWRAQALADHLLESLPDFCLTYSEYHELDFKNAVATLRRAAREVYETDKYKRRGEFGELLLHVILKQVFGTLPAISKLYYKDSSNDTVKGFDAVHVIATATSLELWLGEVKFYENVDYAIRDIVAELQEHTETDYLRGEFAAIRNKLDPVWPFADRLEKLLDPAVSLDEVFDAACVPVLLTYNGDTSARHSIHSDDYFKELVAELEAIYTDFKGKKLPPDIRIHLFLLPLAQKKDLIDALHERLQAWQKT